MCKWRPDINSYMDSIAYTTSYAYNGADQLIQMTYPSGRTVAMTRNVLGQVASVATTQGTTETVSSTMTYQPFGPMSGMIYGNNLVQSRSYDLDYRLTQILTMNGVAHQDMAYTYDSANNITDINNLVDIAKSQTLAYDALNRLSDATSNYGDIDYTYDAIGNRLSETIDAVAETYTYDVNSHHLEQTVNGGVTDYTYDANGNTTSNTTNIFTFGDNNRLKTSGIGASTLATYTYNGRGERVKKDGNGITYYHYDQGGQLIAETDATGTTQVEYIYIDGQPVSIVTSGTLNFIHTDHLGTPQQITDATQAIVWKADYSPFGEAAMTTELITNNLRFPGQYYDSETNLHYNWYRYYDPSTGRYITSDPIGISGGLNTYLYANGNPIILIDPLGLYCLSPQEINGIAGGIGGAFSGAVTGALLASPTGPGAGVGAAIIGALGGTIGAGLGYFGTSSAGGQAASGAGNAIVGSGSPLSSAFGGAVGGATSSALQSNGMSDTHAGIAGGGAGGAVGAASAAFFSSGAPSSVAGAISFALQSALKGGLAGLSGAALSAAIAEALRAGNDCDEDECK